MSTKNVGAKCKCKVQSVKCKHGCSQEATDIVAYRYRENLKYNILL